MPTQTSKSALVIIILTFIGYGLGYFNVFFILPKYLTETQIGIYRVIFDVSYLIYPILQFGGINIVNKFFFDQKGNEGQLLGFSSTLFLIGLVIFVPMFIWKSEFILGVLGFKDQYYAEYLKWVVLSLVVVIGFANLIGSNLRNHRLLTGFNLFNALWLRIAVSIAFTFFGLAYISFEESIVLMTLLVILGVVMLWLYSFIKTKASSLPKISVDGLKRKTMIGYGGVMLIGFGSTIFINKIDTLMTSGIIGLSFAGIYSIAMAFASVIEIPRRSINQVLIPSISKAFSNNDVNKIDEVYKESSISLFFISSFLFICMYLSIDELLNLLPNAEMYTSGKWVVIILGGAKVFDALWGVNSEILILSKFYRYNIALLIVLLFTTVGLNFVFINEDLLITGTAIATGLTVVLYNMIRGGLLYWKLKILPFNRAHTWIFAACLLSVLLSKPLALVIENDFLLIATNTVIVTMLYLAIFLKGGLSLVLDGYKEKLMGLVK